MAIIMMPPERASAKEVEAAFLMSPLSPAPKNWDTTIPHPLERPEAMPTKRKVRVPQLPTAARAVSDTKRPTTMPSTVL